MTELENVDLLLAVPGFREIKHVRRGVPMKETYWEQFMMTGKIDDYLNYKNSSLNEHQSDTVAGNNGSGNERPSGRPLNDSNYISADRKDIRTEKLWSGRKESCESDRTDRHGTLDHAGRRI